MAMVRNLGKMTAVGLVKPMSSAARTVCDRLGDAGYVRKSRLHPLAILLAASTYGRGCGVKGGLSWDPVGKVGERSTTRSTRPSPTSNRRASGR